MKMSKEERVKLVFETISKIAGFEIKPEKEFYMNANGNKGVYKISESLQLLFKDAFGDYKTSVFSILPLFNGGYDLKEIKEPLLTEEENAFLKRFKFKTFKVDEYFLYFGLDVALGDAIPRDLINLKFSGLELYKEYTREELGL